MKVFYCNAIERLPGIEKFPCCWSCHDDDEEHGYPLCSTDLGKNRVAFLCCAGRAALEKREAE